MRSLRRHGRAIGWLGIVALLGNMLVSTVYSAQVQGAQTSADSILGSIVICTAHGTETTPDQHRDPAQLPANHCPLCALHAAYALAVPLILAAIVFSEPIVGRWSQLAHVRTLADHLSFGCVYSRGPPQSA